MPAVITAMIAELDRKHCPETLPVMFSVTCISPRYHNFLQNFHIVININGLASGNVFQVPAGTSTEETTLSFRVFATLSTLKNI